MTASISGHSAVQQSLVEIEALAADLMVCDVGIDEKHVYNIFLNDEAFATAEAPRRIRERSMMLSQSIHFMDNPVPPRLLHGAFAEPSRSLRGAFAVPSPIKRSPNATTAP